MGERILIRPTTKLEFKPVYINVEDCLKRAFQNRPDWLIHNLYMDIERMNLMVAENSNTYTLGSSASIGSDVTSDHSIQKSLRDALIFKELSWNVGLSFTFPFNKQVLENNYQLYKLSFELTICKDELLYKGLYPPLYDRDVTPVSWYRSYMRTYVERDVRQLINIRDLSTFQRFIRMCAARVGQLLNLSSLANDCGITHNTAKAWISVLEASYIIFLLLPHYRNYNKRLVKTPRP